jgi:hypothetical protein
MAATGLGFDDADGARRLWTVSKHSLCGPDGPVWTGAFGTQRDDTRARLGVVGPRYKPPQNALLAPAIDDGRGSTGGDQVLLGCSEAVLKRAGVMLLALEDFGCEDRTRLHVDDMLGHLRQSRDAIFSCG